MTWPIWAWVASLYCRQNSMMLTPCWPSAVPTGGAGVAWPALICSLTRAMTFLRLRLAALPMFVTSCGASGPGQASHCSWLYLGDLVEAELDRCLPVEDADQHLQLRLVDVDL